MLVAIRQNLPKRAFIWISVWVIWFVTLWFLSSLQPSTPKGPEIPHFDKVQHFVYFAIGGVLFSGWLKIKRPPMTALSIILLTTLIGATVGAVDEYHQTFTPGRSGNDPYDWTADLLGSFFGAFCCLRLLFPQTSSKPGKI